MTFQWAHLHLHPAIAGLEPEAGDEDGADEGEEGDEQDAHGPVQVRCKAPCPSRSAAAATKQDPPTVVEVLFTLHGLMMMWAVSVGTGIGTGIGIGRGGVGRAAKARCALHPPPPSLPHSLPNFHHYSNFQ